MIFEVKQSRTLRGLRWRWRLKARNGKVIATSGEDYFNVQDAEDGIALVKGTGPMTEIRVFPAIQKRKWR